MHKAIFSPNERKIIEEYLATGSKGTGTGFRTLKSRVLKLKPTIDNDYILLTKLAEKMETEEKKNKSTT